jgi:hypothetical protein
MKSFCGRCDSGAGDKSTVVECGIGVDDRSVTMSPVNDYCRQWR